MDNYTALGSLLKSKKKIQDTIFMENDPKRDHTLATSKKGLNKRDLIGSLKKLIH